MAASPKKKDLRYVSADDRRKRLFLDAFDRTLSRPAKAFQ